MKVPDLGDILYVDLSDGHFRREPYNLELAERYIGSRGYNARLLWDLVGPGVSPLGPENVLIFGCGLLTGTSVPCSGRSTITCKGPATGVYLKTNVGGQWGAYQRYSGFSYIVISGASPKPVYLWIDDGQVELRSADDLWGKDVLETTRLIHQDLNNRDVRVACIGPAGENLVLFASVMCGYNAAGRGGAGAVMGSKKLKAIAVRGTQPVRVANPGAFKEALSEAWEGMVQDPIFRGLHDYGTSGGLVGMSEALHILPTDNFQRGSFEDADKISGEALVHGDYLKRRMACFACPIGCHRYVELDRGPYRGHYSGGPEYETLSSLGSGCNLSDMGYIVEANRLCNIYGMDTISAGGVAQWLLECHQRELDFDREGLDLSWGNGQTVVELMRRIAFREGIGDLLAKGTMRAAEEMGQGSHKWAVQARGLEQSRVDTRGALGYALAFAVNPRGPDHLHTECGAEFGTNPKKREIVALITGDEKYADPTCEEMRAEIVRWHEDIYAITEGLGICVFTSTAGYFMTASLMAEFFQATTGRPMDEERLMRLGRRIVTLEKCFNVREGLTRANDKLPWRLMHERPLDKPEAHNSPEQLNRMLDRYYRLHGWDVESSWPYEETLLFLEMEDIAQQLEKQVRLPRREG
jgi:aldehyde:ferredoxin oxidoreductase